MLSEYLVDSSFLYALFDKDSTQHLIARQFVDSSDRFFLFPEVTLGEVTFLFRREGGIQAVARFLNEFLNLNPTILPLEKQDLHRAREILLSYPESRLDFVDCCLMALSERLTITRICTFDRRDFSIFRPRHATHLTLLPEF